MIMKEFLLSLIFGKMILLTPNPIDIYQDWVNIELKKPVSAITEGAMVNVELESNRHFSDTVKAQENISKYLKGLYPDDSIEAVLTTKDNKIIQLTNTGFYTSGYSESENIKVLIKLTGQPRIPTDMEFTSLKIRSMNRLEKVLVHWKNFSK